MKVRSSLIKRWLSVLLVWIAPLAYAAVDAGYEAAKRPSGQSNPTCPTNSNLPDSWGFSVSTCECTSYVAYRLNLNDVRHNGVLFKNNWTSGVNFGNAYNWNNAATAMGIREDKYPAVGSVAHWESIAGTGHVAYVQHLFTHPNDGRLTGIGIMEYNWGNPTDHMYRYRRIGNGRGEGFPNSFLHFEEKGTDANDTNATCVAGLGESKRPSGANQGSFCWKHTSNSDATCGSGTEHYYYDYRTCQKYTVTSSSSPSKGAYCNAISASPNTYPGYTARIAGSGFPESIAPSANGSDFASCSSGSLAQGNSREVSGRLPPKREKFWRGLNNALN